MKPQQRDPLCVFNQCFSVFWFCFGCCLSLNFLCFGFAFTVSLPWILVVVFWAESSRQKLIALLESGQIWHYPLFLLIGSKFWPVLGILVSC